MAISRNWNIEWPSHNSQRHYPLAEDASGVDTSGSFLLPQDFLLGCILGVNAGMDVVPDGFLLRTLGVSPAGAVVIIGYSSGGTPVNVATAFVPREGHVRNRSYRLGGIGDFADSDGWIQIGDFAGLDRQPSGMWSFDLAGGRLEPDAIRPQIRGVTRIAVQNGTEVSDYVTGDVVLRAGTNMRLTLVQEVGEDPVIRFDAIEAAGLSTSCECSGDNAQGDPIRTIDGVAGTADGDFTLLGSDCLTIEEIANGLRLRNICSEPCCGPDELLTVTQALELFGQQAATLERFATSLEARVTQADQVLLASKLGDRGCNQCE